MFCKKLFYQKRRVFCMKKYKSLLICVSAMVVLILSFVLVGCNKEEVQNGYVVNVASEEKIPSDLSVQLVDLNGEIKIEKPLKNGKVLFDIETNDSYIVKIVGLQDSFDYAPILLDKNNKTANIKLSKSKEIDGKNHFSVGIFVLDENNTPLKVNPLGAQMCLENCYVATNEEETSVLNFNIPSGEYHFVFNCNGYEAIEQNILIDANTRYAIIKMIKK